MAVKVAINGFGRIGRLAFRQMFGAEGYEVDVAGSLAVLVQRVKEVATYAPVSGAGSV